SRHVTDIGLTDRGKAIRQQPGAQWILAYGRAMRRSDYVRDDKKHHGRGGQKAYDDGKSEKKAFVSNIHAMFCSQGCRDRGPRHRARPAAPAAETGKRGL